METSWAPMVLEAALTLADTHTLGGIDDVEYRINGLADLFAQCEDTRGLFATVSPPHHQSCRAGHRCWAV